MFELQVGTEVTPGNESIVIGSSNGIYMEAKTSKLTVKAKETLITNADGEFKILNDTTSTLSPMEVKSKNGMYIIGNQAEVALAYIRAHSTSS